MQRAGCCRRGVRGIVACATAAMCTQRRWGDEFRVGRTALTQLYARGNVLPRVLLDDDNALDQSQRRGSDTAAAAMAATGNPRGIVYDGDNIFHVRDYSAVERDHYRGMPGAARHAPETVSADDGRATAQLLRALGASRDASTTASATTRQAYSRAYTSSSSSSSSATSWPSLEELWWQPLLRHFPVLHVTCDTDASFKSAWEAFYVHACAEVHDAAAVTARSRPFLRTQRARNALDEAMVWRIAEHLADALDAAPRSTRYEKRISRIVVERVTKLMLDTVADEAWAHETTTSPLTSEIGNLRASHDADIFHM